MLNQLLRLKIILILTLTFGMASTGFGAQFFGGNSLLHSNSALLVPPGGLDVNLYVRGYTTIVELERISNGTSAMAIAYGFIENFELGFSQILYQDLNLTYRPKQGETSVAIPGDTYLRLKWGGIPISKKAYFAAIGNVRYRMAEFYDIHLEPYKSGAIEPELTLCVSQYWDPLNPDEDKSMHGNLGFIFHNDTEKLGDASMELTFLYSMFMPRGRSGFGFELYGAFFLQRPEELVFARENWAYMTPVYKYQILSSITLTTGLDILLMGRENTSTRNIGGDALNVYPNYADWRLTTKVSYTPYDLATIMARQPGAGGGRPSGRRMSGGGGGYYDRQSLFRLAIEDQVGSVEATDLDLEKLRQERIKAEEELKRLKRKLENKKRDSKR